MKQRIINFAKSDLGIALLITILWHLAITLISVAFAPSANGLLSHTMHFDSGWYATIIKDHYQTNLASAAFYPLFPFVVSLIVALTGGLLPLPYIGLIINIVTLWFAIIALIKISAYFLPHKFRMLPVLLLLASPAAFFLHMFYSESLFIAIGFGAYLFALKRQWWKVGILLAILTACRLPSLLFVGLCGLEYLRTYKWRLRGAFNPQVLWFLLAPLGFTLYGFYLAIVTRHFFGMFSAYKATNDWAYQVFNLNIFETVARASYQTLRALFGQRQIDLDIVVNHAIPLLALSILLISSIYLLFKAKRNAMPLGIFGIASFIMFTLNSNVVSSHRYILPCIGIYIALAILFVQLPKWRYLIIAGTLVSLVLQLFLLFLFVNNQFAG